MPTFIAFFLQELKRFLCRRNFIIYGIILIVSLIAVLSSISGYKATVAKEKEFFKMEAENFKNLRNYVNYSKSGINIFFYPTAANVLFANPVVMSELVAHIDTIVTLNIHSNCQGKLLFIQNSYFQMRLSTILLLLASLLALFIAYDSLRELEYLKFLASASSEKAVYISIILSRFFLVILSFLTILFFALCIMSIKGIYLNKSDFVGLQGFLIGALVMLMAFFFLGTAIGKIRSQGISTAVLLASWIILVLMMPVIFDSIIEGKANDIPSYYKVYNDKLSVVSSFEKWVKETEGPVDEKRLDVFRKLAESYFIKEYKEIEAIEEKFKEEIKQEIKLSNQLYNLLPSTFYLSTASEAGGRGYQNFLDFYSYLQELRRQLLRFWIDRVYYNDPKVMVNFVKKDENVFKTKSQLPFYFDQGVLINLGYSIVFLFLSYFFFRLNLFHLDKNSLPCTHVDLKIKPKQIIGANKDFPDFSHQILNVFFGKIKHFSGKISIDGENIVTRFKKNFLYLPKHEHFPDDIKTKHLVALFKRLFKLSGDECLSLKDAAGKANLNKYFVKLSKIEKTKLLMTLVSFGKNRVYILDDFGNGSTNNDRAEMNKLTALLRDRDIIVLDFCTSGIPWLSTDAVLSVSAVDNEFISTIQI